MPGTPTARLKLPVPAESDPADVPVDLGKLATALDSGSGGLGAGNGVVVSGQGLLAARPAAGVQGRLYYATDLGATFLDDGTAWRLVAGLTRISDQRLAADAATIQFSSIPQIFSHLRLMVSARSTVSGQGLRPLQIRFNGDPSPIYDFQYLQGTGTTAPSTGETFGATQAPMGVVGNADLPGMPGASVCEVFEYASTAGIHKRFIAHTSAQISLSTGGIVFRSIAGAWRGGAAAVTAITLMLDMGNLASGAHATLYGIA